MGVSGDPSVDRGTEVGSTPPAFSEMESDEHAIPTTRSNPSNARTGFILILTKRPCHRDNRAPQAVLIAWRRGPLADPSKLFSLPLTDYAPSLGLMEGTISWLETETVPECICQGLAILVIHKDTP